MLILLVFQLLLLSHLLSLTLKYQHIYPFCFWQFVILWLSKHSTTDGLSINVDKNKYMSFTGNKHQQQNRNITTCNE
jgi:uncharacterized membrane protein